MDKFKKIATMVVSIVMAGTMVFSLAACSNTNDNPDDSGNTSGNEGEGNTDNPGDSGSGSGDTENPGDSGSSSSGIDISSPAKIVTYLKSIAPQYENYYNIAWQNLYEYYTTKVLTRDTSNLTITENTYTSGTTVRMAIGYNSATTAMSYDTTTLPLTDASGSSVSQMVLPDGKTYSKSDLKPIWQELEDALGIQVSDVWDSGWSDTLEGAATVGLDSYELIGAGNVSSINTQASAGTLLNLADYLDRMPNLRAFLYENTMAEIGTLSDASTGSIYYAPYYAGMNDAERYNLFRKDYVSELLDYADDYTINGGTITYAAQAAAKQSNNLGARQSSENYVGTSASIESYMGQTGSYVVSTTDPGSSDGTGTVYVRVNYDAALSAAKDVNTALGKAISDAAGSTYSGTSGNIVDLQNFAINQTSGAVTGDGLLEILRAYIDVAYEWAETENATSWSKFYNTTVNGVATTRGDLFNSTYACWDVDTYAAIGRCFVTCGNVLGEYQSQASSYTNYGASTWLLVPRTGYTNRTTRVTAMIGELYGVRGMESMTYLDTSGNLRQTRFNESTWDALTRFSAFHTEGLVPSFNTTTVADEIGSVGSSSANSMYDGVSTHFQGLSSNDYVHTQTTGYTDEYASSAYVQTTDGYNWTCVVTPVSRWLTNDTSETDVIGGITKTNDTLLAERDEADCMVMRFTESALKLKTGGIVIPATVANNENTLSATLAALDYMYSNDGMIETSFGTRSDTDQLSGNATDGYTTTNNGFWYGEKVTSLTINGTVTDISNKTMAELADLGVVKTNDGGKSYTMTEAYQSQALVYKNVLYKTGTNSSTNGGVDSYDDGYLYKGKMTPYYTQAVRELCLNKVAVNGYKTDSVMSSTNLQNLVLGMESTGIVDNASMVQLCNDMSVAGFDIFSAAMGNGSLQTVSQGVGSNIWYTVAPTVTLSGTALDTTNGYADFTLLFKTSSSLTTYFILEVAWYGSNASLSSWALSSNS